MAIGVLAGWTVGSQVHSVEHPFAGIAVAVAIGIAVWCLAWMGYMYLGLSEHGWLFYPIALCSIGVWSYAGYRVGLWIWPNDVGWRTGLALLGGILACVDRRKVRSG